MVIHSLLKITLILKISFGLSDSNEQLQFLKVQCEDAFKRNDYRRANSILNKIITLDPNDEKNYYKRATTNFARSKYKQAIKDLKIVAEKNPSFYTAKLYLAKSKMYLCELDYASQILQELKSTENSAEATELLKKIAGVKPMRATFGKLSCFNMNKIERVASVCSFDGEVISKFVKCLHRRKNFDQLSKAANKLIKIDPNDMNAYNILADSYFNTGKTKMAFKVIKAALKKDPENKTLKKFHKRLSNINRLGDLFETQKTQKQTKEATATAETLVQLLPEKTFASNAVYTDLCVLQEQTQSFEKAVESCSKALGNDEKSTVALKSRAKAYMALKQFEKAAIDYKHVSDIDFNDFEARRGYQDAQQKAKQADMKDYYAILGIPKSASAKEIKKAYHKSALKWHPDKWKKKEEKEIAQKKYLDINEANKVLSDPQLKRRYDAGENVYKEGENSGPNFRGGGGHPFTFTDGRSFFMHF